MNTLNLPGALLILIVLIVGAFALARHRVKRRRAVRDIAAYEIPEFLRRRGKEDNVPSGEGYAEWTEIHPWPRSANSKDRIHPGGG
jgi:hypothetical protein